jgi:hypothetical protein
VIVKLFVLAFVAAAVVAFAAAQRGGDAAARSTGGGKPETREVSERFRKADAPITLADERGLPPKARGDENRVPRIGDTKYWVALDDTQGFYVKTFRLRGISQTAELWVATNLDFLPGDCRNDGVRNVITDEQVAYMLGEFDTTIRPIDTDWFDEPAFRDGKDAQLVKLLPSVFGNGSNAYFNKQGRDVILVDNVRDDNYYDFNNSQALPRIAGFFTSAMPFFHDRNVITIDSFAWTYNTGPNPPHLPSTDPCLNRVSNPFLYESVIAHEYQHLIHADYDPDELSWVNEGMSVFAETLTGYADQAKHIDEQGSDSSTQSFLGWQSVFHPDWNPIPRPAGPENSLTAWGDQGDLEILADYGAAGTFMTYLQSQGYGQDFFKAWHHGEANGIDGLDDALASAGSSDTFYSLFNNFQAASLADGYLDNGASIAGAAAGDLQNAATEATVFFSGNANDTEGAPPWGSDFIPLGPGSGLSSVAFNGDEQFVFPAGPQWVLNNGYFAVIGPDETQYENNLDVSITHEITISGAGVLTFNHYIDSEEFWDFGFVQISDDGGATWTSIPCSGTTFDHDPGAISSIVENLPGYTGAQGTADAPLAATCDLSAYSGNVLLAFRFISDPSVQFSGWFVKDVQLDGAPVGTPGSLAGWNNQKFYDPAALDFTIQFVGIDGTVDGFGDVTAGTNVVVVRPAVDANNDATLSAGDLAALAGSAQVVAIISGVPETEESLLYSPYSLLVNGAERSDGQ